MSFLNGPATPAALEAFATLRKNSPQWGVSFIVTTDWHQVKWRQHYCVRANDAGEALALALMLHGEKIPIIGALDNLATYVEPLCSGDSRTAAAQGKGDT